jgi:hypothetical protein
VVLVDSLHWSEQHRCTNMLGKSAKPSRRPNVCFCCRHSIKCGREADASIAWLSASKLRYAARTHASSSRRRT